MLEFLFRLIVWLFVLLGILAASLVVANIFLGGFYG